MINIWQYFMSNNDTQLKLNTEFQYIFKNILCILTFIINKTRRKHRLHVEHFQKNYGNIYYFNEMTYCCGIKCKHVNMNNIIHLLKYRLHMF